MRNATVPPAPIAPTVRPPTAAIAPPRRRLRKLLPPVHPVRRGLLLPAAAAAAVLLGATMACTTVADRQRQRAEVQINLCGDEQQVAAALGLKATAERPTEAWYFDSTDLANHARGVVYRLRLGDGPPALTLKVASQDCAKVPAPLLPRGQGKCEFDLHGDALVGAVSLDHDLGAEQAQALIAGALPLADALGEAQARYLREETGAWPVAAATRPLGPVYIRAYRAAGQRFVVEAWRLPGGERYLEISEKTDAAEAMQLRDALRATLAAAGVAACADQSSQAGSKLRALVKARNR